MNDFILQVWELINSPTSPYLSLCLTDPVTAGLLIGAGSVVSSFVGGLFGKSNSVSAAQLNQKYWKEQFSMLNERQNYLMNNQTRMQLNGLRSAGINVNSMSGGFTNTAQAINPSGGTASAASVPDMNLGSAIAQGMQVGAQVENTKQNTATQKAQETAYTAQAKAAEAAAAKDSAEAHKTSLENQQTEDMLQFFQDNKFNYAIPIVDENGNVSVQAFTTSNPKAAEQLRNRLSDAVQQVDLIKRIPQNQLAAIVANLQKENPNIVSSIADMPAQEYNKVIADMAEINSRIGLNSIMGKYYKSMVSVAPSMIYKNMQEGFAAGQRGFTEMTQQQLNMELKDQATATAYLNNKLGDKAISEKEFVELENRLKTDNSAMECMRKLFGPDVDKMTSIERTTLWIRLFGNTVNSAISTGGEVLDLASKTKGIMAPWAVNSQVTTQKFNAQGMTTETTIQNTTNTPQYVGPFRPR